MSERKAFEDAIQTLHQTTAAMGLAIERLMALVKQQAEVIAAFQSGTQTAKIVIPDKVMDAFKEAQSTTGETWSFACREFYHEFAAWMDELNPPPAEPYTREYLDDIPF